MNCPHDSRLDDFIDGTLPTDDMRALDTHVAGCTRCRETVDSVRGIVRAARLMERRAVPATLWPRIERTIAAPPTALARRSTGWLAAWRTVAAAVVLLAVAGGVSWLGSRLASLAPARDAVGLSGVQPDPTLVQSVETELRLAEEHYANAIAGLEAMAQAEHSALDPQTGEVMEASLAVIDTAIGESRAALRTEPSNALAQESLFNALHSKVSLLQQTVALINEMRSGDEAGAGRILSGMTP